MITISKTTYSLLIGLCVFVCSGLILGITGIVNAIFFGSEFLERYVHVGFSFLNVVGALIGLYNLINAARNEEKLKKMKVYHTHILGSLVCMAVNVYALLL